MGLVFWSALVVLGLTVRPVVKDAAEIKQALLGGIRQARDDQSKWQGFVIVKNSEKIGLITSSFDEHASEIVISAENRMFEIKGKQAGKATVFDVPTNLSNHVVSIVVRGGDVEAVVQAQCGRVRVRSEQLPWPQSLSDVGGRLFRLMLEDTPRFWVCKSSM